MANALDIRNQAMGRLGFGQPISSAGVVPYGNYAQGVNQFMTQQAQAPYVANLPGYLPAISQQGAVINQQLKGELPQDVINQISQQAAERGITTGSPGSPNANTAYLRALGLTSLGQQQQGMQNLGTAIQQTPVPPIFSPASIAVPGHTALQELNAAMLGMGGKSPGGRQVVASSGWSDPRGNTATSLPQFSYPGGGNSNLHLPTDDQINQIANGSLPMFTRGTATNGPNNTYIGDRSGELPPAASRGYSYMGENKPDSIYQPETDTYGQGYPGDFNWNSWYQ